MNLDEQFSDNSDKQMLIQLVNENVIRFQPKQNSKSAVFTALFFCLTRKSYKKEVDKKIDIFLLTVQKKTDRWDYPVKFQKFLKTNLD